MRMRMRMRMCMCTRALFEQINGALVVLLVEGLDGLLLGLERLTLARHALGDGVHHRLELLFERVVARVELQALLEHHLREGGGGGGCGGEG